GKKVKLFLWTGNCNPSENALRICRENNILNLNGGEYRFDKQNPSISMVPPLLRPVGKEKQVLIGAANEMIYTNNWSRNFEGFSNVLETIKKTGYPRRLKPANLYLHFFTVEKKPSAAAVHGIIKEFLQMDLAPLFTGEYAAMAQDYSNAELRSDDKFWYWENCGSVPSLRLEGKVYPDMLSSKGILGYYFDSKLNCTYIHLDGSGKGRTCLSSKPAESIYLKRSNTTVSTWVLEKNSLSFTAKARGRLDFQISGLESGKEYTLEVDGQAIVLNTDSSGLLEGKKLSEKFGLVKLRLSLVGK
ncbi:MAG: hypothetical protein NE328_23310, partial [Lentisphaeraceae bacterium]|nr:hypothetical protein [Lentisphaeraceae bacterium]